MGGAEPLADTGPAPLFNAAHGNHKLGLCRDEHSDVDDPVLLRAGEDFAFRQQNGPFAAVADEDLGHRTVLRGLGDFGRARLKRLFKEDIGPFVSVYEIQRKDGRVAVMQGLAERQAAEYRTHGAERADIGMSLQRLSDARHQRQQQARLRQEIAA